MPNLKYLLVLAVVATMASSALASLCYNCDSAKNPRCGQHFDPADILVTNCSSKLMRSLTEGHNANVNGCLKLTKTDDLGGQTILRTCDLGEISLTGDSCKHDPTKPVSCYICTDDLCNGLPGMTPLTIVNVLLFFGPAHLLS